MIKLTSFYPFENLLRVSQEFHEDKVIVKMKSLTFEREFEVNYNEIVEISYERNFSRNQLLFSFGILVFVGLIFTIFSDLLFANLLLLRITQTIYVLAVTLFFTGFIKTRYYFFSDKNDKTLTSIKTNRKNYNFIENAIKLVSEKSEFANEITLETPFPEEEPIFEITDFDVSDYFGKWTKRFYENRVISHHKSIANESVSNIEYDLFSGKITRAKFSNENWDAAFWLILAILVIIAGFDGAFSILPRKILFLVVVLLALLLVICFILRYVKQEFVGFYDKNDSIIYWIRSKKSSEEKIEEIIKFIQSKIPAENKE